MFIASLTYVKPLTEVEQFMEEHIAFLDKYYAEGKFICSGRKNPRTGGIIIFNAADEAEMEQVISEDPFKINGVADYEIIEFYPTKSALAFKDFIQ